jgi:hypothetical protein
MGPIHRLVELLVGKHTFVIKTLQLAFGLPLDLGGDCFRHGCVFVVDHTVILSEMIHCLFHPVCKN